MTQPMTKTDQAVVYIVDDDPAVLKGLQLLMRSVELETQTFESAEAFLDAFDPKQHGCVVLDVRMRGMSGLQLQEELEAKGSELPIIFLSGHGDIPMAVRTIKRGAVDFIEKPFRDQTLLDRVQEALARDAESRVSKATCQTTLQRISLLTPKEREVLDLIIEGKANKEMAAMLGITTKAIEARRAKVMEKMQADGVADLVRMVVESRR